MKLNGVLKLKKRQYKKNQNKDKTITLQLRELNGEIVESNQITLTNNDTLIMEFDPDIIDFKIAYEVYSSIHKSLTKRVKMIGYPMGITLKVLRVE